MPLDGDQNVGLKENDMAGIAYFYGIPEIAIFFNWYNLDQNAYKIHPKVELILATGNGLQPYEEKQPILEKDFGFQVYPNKLRNPNSGRYITCLAATPEQWNKEKFKVSPNVAVPTNINNFWHFMFPSCCGFSVIYQPFRYRNEAEIKSYFSSRIGCFSVPLNSDTETIRHLTEVLGFTPVYHLTKRTVFYKHITKESL